MSYRGIQNPLASMTFNNNNYSDHGLLRGNEYVLYVIEDHTLYAVFPRRVRVSLHRINSRTVWRNTILCLLFIFFFPRRISGVQLMPWRVLNSLFWSSTIIIGFAVYCANIYNHDWYRVDVLLNVHICIHIIHTHTRVSLQVVRRVQVRTRCWPDTCAPRVGRPLRGITILS